jgi:hypothetical protein
MLSLPGNYYVCEPEMCQFFRLNSIFLFQFTILIGVGDRIEIGTTVPESAPPDS